MCCALCAVLAGCRRDPHISNHIDILNAEKRVLEDQVYALEYDYQRKCDELQDAREELERLESGTSPRSRASSRPTAESPDDDAEAIDLSPPSVTPGTLDEPRIEIPELPAPRNEEGASEPRWNSTEPVSVGATEQPNDPAITHIHIDPLRTGGSDFDQQPGDDGVMVVIQPRNANDEFVPLAGPVSVVLLDYAKREAGDEARLARWNLNAQQVDELLEDSESEQGIYLRLAWSDKQPENSKLLVAVRFTTADGRKLESRRDIFITLPGQFSQRWTPRSMNRREDSGSDDGINVARQPSLDDEAIAPPTMRNRETQQRGASRASYVVEPPAADHSTLRPVWRPDR